MVASTDIKFYVHTNNNAPQLQNAYGSMINVLDACLVNGINIGTISSLAASGTTVTALFSSLHNLMQYQVIKITGANQSEFNGEHRILTVPNAQSVTFELAAAPSTTIATGTITASLPPMGWDKPFSSVNPNGGGKAAYRSTNLLLPSRPFLRVVDELDPAYTATYAKYAKVGIVEDMIDIDTMLGVQAPFNSAYPDKNWVGTGNGASAINGWAKWYYSRSGPISNTSNPDTAPRSINGSVPFIIIGTKDCFYILNDHHHTGDNANVYAFGHLDSDERDVFLSASMFFNSIASDQIRTNYNTGLSGYGGPSQSQLEMIRKYDGSSIRVGSCQPIAMFKIDGLLAFQSGAGNQFSNDVVLSEVYCVDSFSAIRGKFPLLNYVYSGRPFTSRQLTFQKNRIILPVNIFAVSSPGQVAFDIGEF